MNPLVHSALTDPIRELIDGEVSTSDLDDVAAVLDLRTGIAGHDRRDATRFLEATARAAARRAIAQAISEARRYSALRALEAAGEVEVGRAG